MRARMRGRWLVRIEDIDAPRCVAGADALILAQLAGCGLRARRAAGVAVEHAAIATPRRSSAACAAACAYPCGCTRRDIEDALRAHGAGHERHHERVYPGTCRDGLHGKPPRAARVRTRADGRRCRRVDGAIAASAMATQNVARAVGDFVLKRADGLWAYQLAVVVDDAAQGITHVVRGEDLADNTARQIHLQRLLGLPTPRTCTRRWCSAPTARSCRRATAPSAVEPGRAALRSALAVLGLHADAATVDDLLAGAVAQWRDRWVAR